MVFPHGGPIPRHPSQLYEAALEGVVLLIVVGLLVRFGALKQPGVITGVFALGYGAARITCEFFREPDAQLGFLWGGLTMGMLLCVPLIVGGIAVLIVAFQRMPKPKKWLRRPVKERNTDDPYGMIWPCSIVRECPLWEQTF
jgi:phosphatidylglycerol:prolipoprotein diacylglycerol transferase